MKTIIKSVAAALTSALLFTAMPAGAHTDEYLATLKAPHDGQLRVAGPYHLELVVARAPAQAAEKQVLVYVTDHAGTPVSTSAAGGSITLLGGGKKAAVKLLPAGDNVLKATAVYASTPDLKAVVSVRLADGSEAGARFQPIAAKETVKKPATEEAVDPHAGHH